MLQGHSTAQDSLAWQSAAQHTWSKRVMPLVQSLTKYRVQVTVQMDLDTMLTQLAIDGMGAASVNLAPKRQAGVQNGAQRVMTIS